MQNSSLFVSYKLPEDFPARCRSYVQKYQPNNMLHYHDCLEIGLCTEGSGAEMIDDQIYSINRNNLTVIQANCIHDSHIPMRIDETGSVWKFIFVSPEKLGIPYEDFGGFVSDNSSLIQLFHLMYNELENKPNGYQNVFISLLTVFLIYAKRMAPSKSFMIKHGLPDQITHAIQRIHFSYSEPISIAQLAKDCHMSVSSLNRMFKLYFNVSPLSYINNVRLTAAVHLLQNTNYPIVSIASSVGFETLSSFNRAFKKKYNETPSSMRQKALICLPPEK